MRMAGHRSTSLGKKSYDAVIFFYQFEMKLLENIIPVHE